MRKDGKIGALGIYTLSLAVLSASFLLMPLVNGVNTGSSTPMYLVGALFWAGLIATIVVAVHIHRACKRSVAFNKHNRQRKRWGLTHFFQNKKALVADVTMLLSLVAWIIAGFTTANVWVHFPLISLLVFSFGMHCMLNGINYSYLEYQKMVRRG